MKLADGSTMPVTGTCTVPVVAIGAYHGKVPCMVADLAPNWDLPLGDSWLCQHKGKLSWEDRTCQVTFKGGTVTLTAMQPSVDTAPPRMMLMTAMQAKRALRHSEQCFVLHITGKPAKQTSQGGGGTNRTNGTARHCAVLLQHGKPIAFESAKLEKADVNKSPDEKELLAVYHALKVWRNYLHGTTFTVVSDHNPLTFLPTQHTVSPKQARILEYLATFNFEWKYIPGRTNVADPLSRRPDWLAGLVLAVTTRSRTSALPGGEAA